MNLLLNSFLKETTKGRTDLKIMKRLRNNHLQAKFRYPIEWARTRPPSPFPTWVVLNLFAVTGPFETLVKALGLFCTKMQRRPHFLFILGSVHSLPKHAGTVLLAEGPCPGAEALDPAGPTAESASARWRPPRLASSQSARERLLCRSRWTGLALAVGGTSPLRSV